MCCTLVSVHCNREKTTHTAGHRWLGNRLSLLFLCRINNPAKKASCFWYRCCRKQTERTVVGPAPHLVLQETSLQFAITRFDSLKLLRLRSCNLDTGGGIQVEGGRDSDRKNVQNNVVVFFRARPFKCLSLVNLPALGTCPTCPLFGCDGKYKGGGFAWHRKAIWGFQDVLKALIKQFFGKFCTSDFKLFVCGALPLSFCEQKWDKKLCVSALHNTLRRAAF